MCKTNRILIIKEMTNMNSNSYNNDNGNNRDVFKKKYTFCVLL